MEAGNERSRLTGAQGDNGREKSVFPKAKLKPKKMGRNQMASRKTAARGLSDITLLIANATQLKSVMIQGKSNPYYTLLITLIPTSLVLQVVAALVIIVQGALEAKADPSQDDDDDDDDWDEILAKWLSELAVFLAFLITVVNVFISAFVNKGL